MVDVSPFTIGTLLLLKMGLMYIYISKNYILFITEVLKAFSQLRYQFKLLGLANLKTLFVTIIVSIVERERERADILGSQTVSLSMSLSHN